MPINEKGQEVLDPTPMVLHTGVRLEESMDQRIQRLIALQVSKNAEQLGLETYEESIDFEVDDPFDIEASETQYTTFKDEYLDQDHPEPVEDPQIDDPAVETKQKSTPLTKEEINARLEEINERISSLFTDHPSGGNSGTAAQPPPKPVE